jgi:NAD-dependent SIR2 family protein deacetylase
MNNEAIRSSPSIADLADLLRGGPFAVITGAGLSTGSGIPAYRDRHGQWQQPSRPVQHQEFLSSPAMRQRYWARSFVGWRTMGQAAPNAGHHALAQLEQHGCVSTVITQNVDGLHHRAGSKSVIELHGSIGRVHCLSCQVRYPRALLQEWLTAANPDFDAKQIEASRAAPDGDAHLADDAYAAFKVPPCPACQGVLKPDVVFFGDNVPRERVSTAMQAVEDAAALLIVGSSLMVYSGFRFADRAHRLSKPVVAINQGITRADALLTMKIEDDCGQALQQVLDALMPDPRIPA